jgi:hypothetical protein
MKENFLFEKFKSVLFIFMFFILISFIHSQVFNATDLQKMRKLSSPAVSLDSKYIVFNNKTWDEKTGKSSSFLSYFDFSTNSTYILSEPNGKSDSSPFFNEKFPDLLFFLSTRSGSSQVYYCNFPPNKSELINPVQLTNYPVGIDNIKFVSFSLVFSAEVYFDCLDDALACTASRNQESESRGSNTWGYIQNYLLDIGIGG